MKPARLATLVTAGMAALISSNGQAGPIHADAERAAAVADAKRSVVAIEGLFSTGRPRIGSAIIVGYEPPFVYLVTAKHNVRANPVNSVSVGNTDAPEKSNTAAAEAQPPLAHPINVTFWFSPLNEPKEANVMYESELDLVILRVTVEEKNYQGELDKLRAVQTRLDPPVFSPGAAQQTPLQLIGAETSSQGGLKELDAPAALEKPLPGKIALSSSGLKLGFSGGAVLDAEGGLVGMLIDDTGTQGYAIPAQAVDDALNVKSEPGIRHNLVGKVTSLQLRDFPPNADLTIGTHAPQAVGTTVKRFVEANQPSQPIQISAPGYLTLNDHVRTTAGARLDCPVHLVRPRDRFWFWARLPLYGAALGGFAWAVIEDNSAANAQADFMNHPSTAAQNSRDEHNRRADILFISAASIAVATAAADLFYFHAGRRSTLGGDCGN